MFFAIFMYYNRIAISVILPLVFVVVSIACAYSYRYLMEDNKKLKIQKSSKANDTVTRTIRMNGETFDKISELAKENNDNIEDAHELVNLLKRNASTCKLNTNK